MLESFVSSRIRRTLLEYIVKSPTERFYLRGLAKTLDLPVTPLRRELKRLEHAGMLQACDEGNIRFYTVQVASAAFQELQQATAAAPVPPALPPTPAAVPVVPTPVRRTALQGPALVGMAVAGVAVMLTVVGLAYVSLIEEGAGQRPAMSVATGPSAAGTMRSQRWQLVPGGFGGLSQ